MEVHEAKNYPLITMNLIDRGWEVNEKMPTDDELMRLADKYDVDYYYYKHRVKEENENRVLALELIRKLGSVGLRIEEGPKMEENIIYAIKKLAKIISSIDGDIPESFIKKSKIYTTMKSSQMKPIIFQSILSQMNMLTHQKWKIKKRIKIN